MNNSELNINNKNIEYLQQTNSFFSNQVAAIKGRIVSQAWESIKPTVLKITVLVLSTALGAGIGLIATFSSPGIILGGIAGLTTGSLIHVFIYSIGKRSEQNELLNEVVEEVKEIIEEILHVEKVVENIEETVEEISQTNEEVIELLNNAVDRRDIIENNINLIHEEIEKAVDHANQMLGNENNPESAKDIQKYIEQVNTHCDNAKNQLEHLEIELSTLKDQLCNAREHAVHNQETITKLEETIQNLENQISLLGEKAVQHASNVHKLNNQNGFGGASCLGGMILGTGVAVPIALINPVLGAMTGAAVTAAGIKAIHELRRGRKKTKDAAENRVEIKGATNRPKFDDLKDDSFILLSRSSTYNPKLADIKDESFILLARSRS